MSKLLHAGLLRLIKCPALWLSCAFTAVMQISTMLSIHSDMVEYGEKGSFFTVDYGIFYFSTLAIILVPFTTSFFIGPEYGDGTLRNKIITGSRRRNVYLSNLCLSSLAAVIICAFGIAASLAVGLPLLGSFGMETGQAIVTISAAVVMAIAVSSISTLLMMLVSNRTVSTVAVIAVAAVMLVGGMSVNEHLKESATYTSTERVGDEVRIVEKDNPNYVKPGAIRYVLEFLDEVMPGGQAADFVSRTAEHPALMISYSAALFAVVSAVGVAVFEKKDLR